MTVSIGEPIRLYEGVAPGSEDWTQAERAYWSPIFGTDVVTNVVVPTLTPVMPADPCGTAVIVAPGGGFHAHSINSEGFDVARWLAARGVVAFVLKYRLVPSGDDAVAEMLQKPAERTRDDMAQAATLAAADAKQAVRLVRSRSASLGFDPRRVGFIGFSAGGNVAMSVAMADDAAERPDFVAPIYATARGIDLTRAPAGGAPMFLVVAADDQLGLATDTLEICNAWRTAKLPVELHMYAAGGHGFGMREQGLPSDTWIDRFGDWLASRGLLGQSGVIYGPA